ncbi:MAG TPA: hypothetical protein VM871_04955 [Flavisolibacter sp.]|nr:hypothetical protein [Flavisolibacter sp.]
MAEKDFAPVENQNRGESPDKPKESKPVSTAEKGPTGDESPETTVKNAHASGDGSFGRSESSLPENEEEEANENPY